MVEALVERATRDLTDVERELLRKIVLAVAPDHAAALLVQVDSAVVEVRERPISGTLYLQVSAPPITAKVPKLIMDATDPSGRDMVVRIIVVRGRMAVVDCFPYDLDLSGDLSFPDPSTLRRYSGS